MGNVLKRTNIKSKELNDYGYVDEVLELVSKKNADQPEFLQAVTEVLNTLRPVVDANEELYRSKCNS